LRAKYGIPDVVYDKELITELRRISAGRTIYALSGVSLPGFDNVNFNSLKPVLDSSRVVKTPGELQYMEIAANVSSDAHIVAMKDAKTTGLYEFNYASYFIYYSMNCGLLHQAYLPITAYGKHSAILHYNVPLAKVEGNGLMLIDAGAEYTYGTDISRTFPVNGKFSDKQKVVYNMVLNTVLQIESLIKPGVKFSQMASLSKDLITRALLEADFVRGSLQELMQVGISNYFYPHGLGHSVGIDVHDPGRIEDLAPNMIITIEPGVYFNEVLLEQGITAHERYFNVEKCREYLADNFGGVRIEDMVQITENGVKVLSWVPKTVEGIEEIMAKPL